MSANASQAEFSRWAPVEKQRQLVIEDLNIEHISWPQQPLFMALMNALNTAVALYICPPVVLFGLTTNVVCCVALRRCHYRPATAALIYGLIALFDSVVLALLFADIALPVLLAHWSSAYVESDLDEWLPLLSSLTLAPLAHLLHRFTTLLVLLVTFDRYVAVFKLCDRARLFRNSKHVLLAAGITLTLIMLVGVRHFISSFAGLHPTPF